MKTNIVLCFLFVALMTTGSDCVNKDALVAVNFPISFQYDINPGTNTTFNETKTVVVTDSVASSYRDKIQNASYYDIRVWVSGSYTGSVTGSGFVNGKKLLDFSERIESLSIELVCENSLLGVNNDLAANDPSSIS